MVTFINESNQSLESIFHEFDMAVSDAFHECEYATLAEQYNYVCENGCMMSINEAEEKKEGLLKKLINTLVTGLTQLKDKLVGWCKQHYEGSKLQAVVNKIKAKFSKGKKSIESASTPDEAKEASKAASDDMKEETESDKASKIKKFKNRKIRLTGAFYDAVNSNKVRLVRIMMKDALYVDPTFRLSNAMEKAAASMDGLWDEHDPSERTKIITDKSKWDDDYYNSQLVWLISNFSHERYNHLKDVTAHRYPEYA